MTEDSVPARIDSHLEREIRCRKIELGGWEWKLPVDLDKAISKRTSESDRESHIQRAESMQCELAHKGEGMRTSFKATTRSDAILTIGIRTLKEKSSLVSGGGNFKRSRENKDILRTAGE